MTVIKYLTGTQENMEIAANKIWYNFLTGYANNNEKLVGDCVTHYNLSELQEITESEIIALKAYGKKLGVIQISNGATSSYATPVQALSDLELYVFPKPADSLMKGVENIAELDLNPDWFPVDDI